MHPHWRVRGSNKAGAQISCRMHRGFYAGTCVRLQIWIMARSLFLQVHNLYGAPDVRSSASLPAFGVRLAISRGLITADYSKLQLVTANYCQLQLITERCFQLPAAPYTYRHCAAKHSTYYSTIIAFISLKQFCENSNSPCFTCFTCFHLFLLVFTCFRRIAWIKIQVLHSEYSLYNHTHICATGI